MKAKVNNIIAGLRSILNFQRQQFSLFFSVTAKINNKIGELYYGCVIVIKGLIIDSES